MITVAARGATEDGLRATRLGVDRAARAARLARIGGGYFDERASRPCEFVAEHVREAGPSRVRDVARTVTSDHPCNVQFFQNDNAVVLGKLCRLDMQEMIALPSHLAVDASNARLGFLSVLGSFSPSVDGTLGVGEFLERCFEIVRVDDQIAVRGCTKVCNATIDRDNGVFPQGGLGYVQFADDTDEPLVSVALERAGLGFSFEGAVHRCAERTELGKANVFAGNAPNSGMCLGESEDVATLVLPSWGTSKPSKASLPRSVQFDQELRAYITWNVGEPWERSTQFGQFVDLIEGCWVDTFIFRTRQSKPSLFEREVPKESQSVIPGIEASNLFWRWVDAVTKSFTSHAHQTESIVVFEALQEVNKMVEVAITNDNWVATTGGRKLLIRCEVNDLTWYEVRTIVSKKLGVEPFSQDLTIERNPATAVPARVEVLEVRWTGDDYAKGGTPGKRRMQERAPGGEWVDV